MEIRILGASGGAAVGCHPSSFLVDGVLGVDAGAIASALTLEEQCRVHDILLTHSHLDHVRDLPLLLINCDRNDGPLRVHSTSETIASIRNHLFNKEIWFEAFTMPTVERPLLFGNELKPGEDYEVAGYKVRGFPLHHNVISTGWLVEKGGVAAFFAGDTDEENCLEAVVDHAGDRLRAVFLEASFPNDMANFARMTGHLTPAGLGRAAAAVSDDVAVLVNHLKPGHEDQIRADITAIGRSNIRPVHAGETIRI